MSLSYSSSEVSLCLTLLDCLVLELDLVLLDLNGITLLPRVREEDSVYQGCGVSMTQNMLQNQDLHKPEHIKDADNKSKAFWKIKIPKNRAMSYTQRHIAGLLSWLRVQSLKGAVDQILSYIRTPNRKFVEGEIRRNIEDYACKSSKTLSYLQFNLKSHTSNESYQPLLLDAISKPSFVGNVQEVAKLSAHEINLKRNENTNTTEVKKKRIPPYLLSPKAAFPDVK
uniref:Uncharacterized protein n=1 Tax=Timema genevievae TaxID=629358 RepID=A0A7R9JRH0_TIMGE|nr:unnamed protein product [Timema genevievae]